jgi:hypothetical protein
MKTHKGKYKPKHPEKYKGDPTNIIYRSGWERKVMVWLDTNPNIIQWNSEEVIIPYVKPVDNRVHRYFPDFYAKMVTKDGILKEVLLEIKPKKETREPTKKKRITKQYINEVVTWGTNQAKWSAAREYCSDRGWEFHIITEDHLNL